MKVNLFFLAAVFDQEIYFFLSHSRVPLKRNINISFLVKFSNMKYLWRFSYFSIFMIDFKLLRRSDYNFHILLLPIPLFV